MKEQLKCQTGGPSGASACSAAKDRGVKRIKARNEPQSRGAQPALHFGEIRTEKDGKTTFAPSPKWPKHICPEKLCAIALRQMAATTENEVCKPLYYELADYFKSCDGTHAGFAG